MKIIGQVFLAGLITIVIGCGYRLEGGGYLNDDVTRVAVDVFENKSSESRAGTSFTNELVREILQKTDTQVVDSDHTLRVIKGVVKAITFSTLSRASTESVVERLVTARVDIKLVGAGDEILWSVKDLSSSESYTVDPDKVGDEQSKQEAVDKIARRMAEQVVGRMMTNF